jgi:inorganic pyrophosphatase
MTDSGDSDAKIIAVPAKDPRFENTKNLKDVNPHLIKEFTHFYENYKTLQNKVVTIDGVGDVDEARKAIAESIELYKSKN